MPYIVPSSILRRRCLEELDEGHLGRAKARLKSFWLAGRSRPHLAFDYLFSRMEEGEVKRRVAGCVLGHRMVFIWVCFILLCTAYNADFAQRALAQSFAAQAIRINVTDQQGRCKAEDIKLLANRLVEIHIYNRGTRVVAFHAPEMIERAGLNGVTNAMQEMTTNALLISPGQIGLVSLRTPSEGRYFYACSEANNRDPRRTGLFLMVQEEDTTRAQDQVKPPSAPAIPKK
jgi:hypothetical protein